MGFVRSSIRRGLLATALWWAGAAGACDLTGGLSIEGMRDFSRMDGYFIGGDRCFYPGSTPAASIPPFKGPNPADNRRLFYVNGANGDPARIAQVLEAMAARSNIYVVGLFYASGNIKQIAQGLVPRTPKGASVETLHQLLRDAINANETIHIRAGSAGTFVVGEALRRMSAELTQRRLQPGKGLEQLDLIRVETTGSANRDFPDGPRYVHYINRLDPVAASMDTPGLATQLGARAVLALFTDKAPDGKVYEPDASPQQARFLSVHGPEIYDGYRRRFDSLYAVDADRRGPPNLPRRINLKSIDLPGEGI